MPDATAGAWTWLEQAAARWVDLVLRFRPQALELPVLTTAAPEFLVAPVWPRPVQPRPVRKGLGLAENSESAPASCDTKIRPQPAPQAELSPTANDSGAYYRPQETLLAEWNTSLR